MNATQKVLMVRKYLVMYNKFTSKTTKNTIAILASMKGL